ncbi:ATP-binding protein [Ensifer adhaerens]|uniref:GTP-binding protein n=1 Tax=Ensifer adhaerens TaxID=106592 RepID=A0ABY8HCD6_ENSAD|nr:MULTISPECIES: GTP-binding protein [Ensifer]ANK73683.1 ATP-binding protein [Ensifer adhaerens]KDP70362.1 ATP-binding protein [Ensifer adhaerens]WFP89761.1 GTP-binding protein [Ensifer adhaerens]SFG83574.1 GTPase, G3E family [Ensifer sp. OV372]
MVSPLSAVPVSILTGFLGAGKTTLLNRLLKDPDLSDTAVIINEFGDVSIDHLLVEASSDGVIELSDGCLCCTVRGELVDTLADLMDRMQTGKIKPLKRVVIETTGLADPAPVLQSVIGNPVIAQNFRLDGVVTVVDAVNGLQTIANHEEALKQIAVADRIVISKTGLAETSERDALTARIRALNPRAPLIDGDSAEAGHAELFDCGLYDPSSKIADVGRWLQDEAHHDHHDHDHDHGHDHHDHDHHHDHHHDHGHDHHHHHDVTRHGGDIRSFSIVHDRPIEPMALDMFIDLLRSAHGEKLLRMKAIVAVADRPDRPLVLHGVQNVFHTPERLAAWPDPNDRRTRMVLITKGLEEAFVRDLFDAFTGKPRIDRPDAQALSDNPLAVPGMRF